MSNHRSKPTTTTFPYPNCWKDEARVQVLLAPFRERSVNPENYDSKMKFWKDIIETYCHFKGNAIFCKQELLKTFAHGQRVPSCLDQVLDEMQRLGLIRLRSDYEYDPANSWTGWAVNSLWKKPLNWGQHKMKTMFGGTNLAQMGLIEYVHVEVIYKYCNDLQSLFAEAPYPGTLHHYDKLKQIICPELNVSEECLKLLFLTLFCQQKIGLAYKNDDSNNSNAHLVKIPSTTDQNVSVTEADHAIHSLQMTKDSLLEQLEALEQQIRENEDKARSYISQNKRLMAKSYLRKKHLLEKNHEKRSLALHNVESILSNVDETKHNGLIINAYKYGSKALKDVLEQSNLTYDNVDEVVTEMRETMDNCREVQDSLANVKIDETYNDVEDELERELRTLMNDTIEAKAIGESIDERENNNCFEFPLPQTVEITDAALLAMLEGLEVEQKTPVKNAYDNASNMRST